MDRKNIFAVTGILLGASILAAAWSSINMSLASIQESLNATVLDLQWMMNMYGITICIFLLPFGKLGDSYGRKYVYLAGVIGLTLACIGAGLASHPTYLIACMGLLGVSGASILTLSQALVVHQFPEEKKSKAIGIWATFVSTSLALGPLVAGLVIHYLSWRYVFLLMTPWSILSIIMICLFVKSEKSTESHCDWAGVILLAGVVGGFVTALLQGPAWGWTSWEVISLFMLAVGALIAFIILELRSKEPLFQTELFAHRGFLFASICNGCSIGFIWATFFFMPLYMQNLLGATAYQTGKQMLLITVPVAVLSFGVSRLYEKVGAKVLLFSGYLILFIAVLSYRVFGLNVFCILAGLGWVLTMGPSATKALSSLPHKLAGMASGMFMTLQEIGGVVSLAIAGVVFRVAADKLLFPKMQEIEKTFGGNAETVISDPSVAEKMIGAEAPLFKLLQKAFSTGYGGVMTFLAVYMAMAMVSSLLIPNSKKKDVAH